MELFRRFGADQKGTTALIFGLAVLPLIGIGGAAVDYTRASMTQSRMQMAADLAALAIVKLPTTASQAEINKIAKDTVEASFDIKVGVRTTTGYMVEQPVVTRTSKTVTVKIAGSADSAFMRLAGVPTMELGASSSSTWSARKIEMALVLDNTGSMGDYVGGQRKMDTLITAAKNFIAEARKRATEADTIKISIVPFDTQVRLDPATFRNKDWLRFDNPADRAKWTGSVIDRYGSFAGTDLPATGALDSKYPTLMSTSALAPIMPLASVKTDYARMNAAIEAMKPSGTTNISLGVTWGLATLSGGEPFAEASSDPNVQRFVIVLTDGDNTAYYKDGTKLDSTVRGLLGSVIRLIIGDIDTRTSKACGEAKKTATVHTIKLLAGNDDLLRSCASAAGLYHPVATPGALNDTFQDILNSILGTRVTS